MWTKEEQSIHDTSVGTTRQIKELSLFIFVGSFQLYSIIYVYMKGLGFAVAGKKGISI
jgi:hypothetical protein